MQEKHLASRVSTVLPRYRWVILALSVAAHAGVIMTGLALAPLAPFVLGDLVSSRTELGLLISALLVGAGIGSTPGGWLADRSLRWTLVGGQILLAITVFTLSRVSSLQVSLVLQWLGGLGFGAIVIASTRAVASWFPPHERAMAMGINMAAAPLGNVLISTALPFLGQAWGWRQALLPVCFLVLASGIASAFLFRRSPVDMQVKHEGSRKSVGVWEILKRRDTWLLTIAAILLGGAEHAFRTYFLLHVTEVVLLPVVVGGWYLALAHGSGLVGRIGWGIVADRWFGGDRERVFAILPLLAALAILLLGIGWGSPWTLPVLAILFGLAGAGWVGVWTLILLDRASSDSAGKEIGVGMTFTYVGVVLGPVLFGRGVDLTGSYQTMWIIVAATVIPASAVAFMLRKSRRRTA